MTGLSKFLGRGLLVLALGSYAVACGDDDDDSAPTDAGDSGSGGSSGKGSAGSSGKSGTAGSSGKGGAGSDSTVDKPTLDECMAAASDATGDMVSDECSTCLCEKDSVAVVACTTDCWTLANCVAAKCPPLPNGKDDVSCITSMCDTGAAAEATAVPFKECVPECFMTPPPPDAEVDAGN